MQLITNEPEKLKTARFQNKEGRKQRIHSKTLAPKQSLVPHKNNTLSAMMSLPCLQLAEHVRKTALQRYPCKR